MTNEINYCTCYWDESGGLRCSCQTLFSLPGLLYICSLSALFIFLVNAIMSMKRVADSTVNSDMIPKRPKLAITYEKQIGEFSIKFVFFYFRNSCSLLGAINIVI